MAEENQTTSGSEENAPMVVLHKIFIKDLSFETTSSPDIFTIELKPSIHLDMEYKAREFGDDFCEVVLSITITARVNDQVAYLAEVNQAGVYSLKGFSGEERDQMKHVYCPSVLYPYACSTISELVAKGGFPQLLLNPVNFQQNYWEQKKKKAQQAAAGTQS
jgi:preprotein translocase subunit SecB